MGASCIRWTVDTERAFLLALKQTGQVTRAAAAIGRAPGVCYDRRRRRPAFAQAWDEALTAMEGDRLAEVADATGTALTVRPLLRARRDGWTQQRRRAFARALADTGSYGQAAAQVGISMTSVQRLRRRSPEFQAACDQALVEGGTTVEEAAYVRAVEGWEEPVIHNGQVVGYRRRFSDVLAKTLLERRDGGTPERPKRGEQPVPTQAEVDAVLMKRLEALARRMAKKEKAEQDAWCERMKREGWAP